MDIEYIHDTGSRHEWECVHCELKYLITFHYLDGTWSALRIREDGEREILKSSEAETLLSEFPRAKAMRLIRSGKKEEPLQMTSDDAIETELDMPDVGEGPLDLGSSERKGSRERHGSSERKEEGENADSERPSA